VRSLVIGYGSIGKRHSRILRELGCKVAVVSRHSEEFCPSYKLLDKALEKEKPEYIVIANETSKHLATVKELAQSKFRGIVLIEKPLFNQNNPIPLNDFSNIFIGYNLRFHPIIKQLCKILSDENILSIQAYVGQYLPDWRSGRDYRDVYSSKKSEGGGVLRDLSHELDYLNWLSGGWEEIVALGGHYSNLQIDSDDIYTLLIKAKRSAVIDVQLNYVDRLKQRQITINTNDLTIRADLIRGYLEINDMTYTFEVDRDLTYREQHIAILNGDWTCLCDAHQGLDVLKIIDAAEKSAQEGRWVRNA